MIEILKYTNHMNESLTFGEGSLFVNESDLHNFSWSVTSKNNRISGFSKGIVSKTIPIILKCNTPEEGLRLRNKLFEVFEKDVVALKHGKLFIGDYYLKCFVIESNKSDYLLNDCFMKITVKVTTDFPFWIKETTETFNYGAGSSGENLDFDRDFPSDYTSNLIGKRLNNTDFVPSNFRMVVYGACENPKVTIAGHDYEVSVVIAANEYLTIDSVSKTIVLTRTDGTQENYFNKRNKESYIFEKLPVGISNVSAEGNFKFDITLLEERSEPRWT